MAPLLFVLVFGAVAIGTYYFQARARQVRARSIAALAQAVGFTFSASDTAGIAEMPFSLFRMGRGHKAGPVISGTHNGLPLRIFDYQYVTGEGRSRQVHRNTCAILTVPAACPVLRLTHENALTRLADHFEHHDVKLEYDDFNLRFQVSCEHQKFAFSLLDAQMMEWLLTSDSFDRVEIVGPWVLLVRTRLEPARWLSLGNWLTAFHQHIPEVVYSAYPPR
jgi:hypothetical protein